MNGWMNAQEAAERLGVSRQTLYAYVSRGLLRAEPVDGQRSSRYRHSDVERLAQQRQGARNPRQAAQATLDWGLPVMASSLTLIHEGQLYYRGQDAVALSAQASLEEVAALLWPCDAAALRTAQAAGAGESTRPNARASRPRDPRECLARFEFALACVAPAGDDLVSQGARLLRGMHIATLGRSLAGAAAQRPMHQQLQAAWRTSATAAEALRAALVLCADHELNASSFTTRCVASTGASLEACVAAGLAALSGPRHGGTTHAIEAVWDRWMASASSRASMRRLVEETVLSSGPGCTPQGLGFGHPLYPGGDPRAQALLARLPPDPPVDRFIAAVQELAGLKPSVDFALVALRRRLGLPQGAAFALFAIGRTVGWIAHALEQRASGGLIRPRAAYLGPRPAPAQPAIPPGRMIRRR